MNAYGAQSADLPDSHGPRRESERGLSLIPELKAETGLPVIAVAANTDEQVKKVFDAISSDLHSSSGSLADPGPRMGMGE